MVLAGNFREIEMRNSITKVLLFILFVCSLAWINLQVFRSDLPYSVIITITGSVIILIYFPYNKLFKK